MKTLADVTTPSRDGAAFRIDIADGWRQGRGAYGGLTIAACVRAIEMQISDPLRRVRSVTAVIPAPTFAGVSQIAVEVIRAGSTVSTVRASLVQSGKTTTAVVAIVAGTRPVDDMTWCELSPPDAPAFESLSPVPVGAQFPEFAQNFEYRVVRGIPLTGGAAEAVGWVRAREPGVPRDAAYVAAMIDAWWPGALVKMKAPRPLATIAYTLELVGEPGDGPLLYRGVVPVSRDGYFLETRELWTAGGTLVARNHQTFAIIQ